jgi:hypothetical protein
MIRKDFIYGFLAGWIFNYPGIIGLIIGILIGLKMTEAPPLSQKEEAEVPVTDFIFEKSKNLFKSILVILEKNGFSGSAKN